jgi:5-methylcytosine-specific restriction endonuclease McrA
MRKRHWSYTGEKNRKRVLAAAAYRCQIVGPGCTGVADTVDHIIPKAHGGPDIIENLRASCWMCNQRKGVRVVSDSEASPFFSDGGYRRAPLQNLSPKRRWTPLTPADYRGKP